MKNLFVISKTHLDLGFTDYAENIEKKYLNSFIPGAIDMANELNTDTQKNFVWTTGSWLIKEALNKSGDENKAKLITALKEGNIAPHALPFTTHTELLDEDTLEYGLSIVDEIDKISGRKTIAAKMTDVPGHTKALVPLLAKHGIKLLHIGVNGASAVPNVPPCFLWKCGDSEVVVIYSGDYGGDFKCDLVDDILYFDHSLDNHGTKDKNQVLNKINKLREEYPDYNVTAGRMDDYAEIIWQVKDRLPVLESEIGDSWIHGSAADPYKSASLRTLMSLKRQWLTDGSLEKNSQEYIDFSDNLICIAEHTCGMDMKVYFADYENYLRKDFDKARKEDIVKMKHLFRDFPQNFLTFFSRNFGNYKKGSYSVIEKSWKEQREYVDKALSAMSECHRKQAKKQLAKLMPSSIVEVNNNLEVGKEYSIGQWKISVNEFGGISTLFNNDSCVVKKNNNPVLQYCSYGKKDYDFWLSNYTRNLKQTMGWAIGDFARPLLKYDDNKYKQGRFSYSIDKGEACDDKIIVNLKVDDYCYTNLGGAKKAQIIYSVCNGNLSVEVVWLDKPANRLTESTILRLYPNINDSSIKYTKMGTEINPYDIVENGNRNLSAVENIVFDADGKKYKLINHHSPLVSIGEGKILKFDNKYESANKDGIAYILHNNVWGTNFPLWYQDNAYFKFDLCQEK